MAAPTTKPRVLLLNERGGTLRAMFESPFPDDQQSDAADIINRLRVYHATHPGAEGGLKFLADLTLTFDATKTVYELTFKPGKMGVFSFSFVNALDEEGPISDVARYVYARFSRIQSSVEKKCVDTLVTGEIFDLMEDASSEVETHLGMRFYPYFAIKTLNGNNTFDLPLDEPIVEILKLRFRTGASPMREIDPASYRVYNRHINVRKAFDPSTPKKVDGHLDQPGDGTGGLRTPDDRVDPKISFTSPNQVMLGNPHTNFRLTRPVGGYGSVGHDLDIPRRFKGFGHGRQNIVADGFYGYTEPDLSTPFGIIIASELIAVRQAVTRFGDPDDALEMMRAHRVVMEKTDTNTVMYRQQKSEPNIFFTGDPVIDGYLSHYPRPMTGGVV